MPSYRLYRLYTYDVNRETSRMRCLIHGGGGVADTKCLAVYIFTGFLHLTPFSTNVSLVTGQSCCKTGTLEPTSKLTNSALAQRSK